MVGFKLTFLIRVECGLCCYLRSDAVHVVGLLASNTPYQKRLTKRELHFNTESSVVDTHTHINTHSKGYFLYVTHDLIYWITIYAFFGLCDRCPTPEESDLPKITLVPVGYLSRIGN